MQLDLTKQEVFLLNAVLRSPHDLPLSEVGLKPYLAPDEDTANLSRKCKKWLEKHVLTPVLDDKDEVVQYKFEAIKTGIQQAYLGRLKAIFEHYAPIGRHISFCDMYLPLLAKLKGEKLDDEDIFEKA